MTYQGPSQVCLSPTDLLMIIALQLFVKINLQQLHVEPLGSANYTLLLRQQTINRANALFITLLLAGACPPSTVRRHGRKRIPPPFHWHNFSAWNPKKMPHIAAFSIRRRNPSMQR